MLAGTVLAFNSFLTITLVGLYNVPSSNLSASKQVSICVVIHPSYLVQQAQLGVPHSKTQVELNCQLNLQAGICQILNLA